MTPFAVEAAQALLDAERAVIASLFGSLQFAALALVTVVFVAVSWLSWAEARAWGARHRRS